MEWLDFYICIYAVCITTSLMIRNNETNDNRLKTNDNGNSIKMIYEHPLANKINFLFFFDAFSRPISRLESLWKMIFVQSIINQDKQKKDELEFYINWKFYSLMN
jgi:hypothetical protein